jgi:sugar (pentulose or hexulose) kinase
MGQTLLLGIDNGTTVTKAALFDQHGRELAVGSSQEVRVTHPEPGWAEQNMHEVWSATVQAVRECLQIAQIDPSDIAGISFSGHGGGVWLLDDRGAPVRDAIIWLDARAKPILDQWATEGKLEQLYDASGWSLFPGIGACTIFPWLIEHEPDSLRRARINLSSKDWIKYCLTGEQSIDQTMASIAHMDFRSARYSDEVLRLSGISAYRHLLPEVVVSWQVGGKVTAEAARVTGLVQGTPVINGAWDGVSCTLGAGCIDAGEAGTVIGTAGVHAIVSDKPQLDPHRNYSLMYHTVPDCYVKNSLTMLAAGNLNWFEREFCLAERQAAERMGKSVYEVIGEEVADVPVGSAGVLFLPFLQGERAPFVKPEARGVFFGLGDWHTRAHLLRAIFEAVALSTRDNYACMQEGGAPRATYLTGGGSRSPVWCQILADCVGSVMRVPSGIELGARGAAINAAVGVGLFESHRAAVDHMVRIEHEYTPSAQRKERYDQLYLLYRDLIQAVWPVWEKSWQIGVASW